MKEKKEPVMVWLSGMDIQLMIALGLIMAILLLAYLVKESLQ